MRKLFSFLIAILASTGCITNATADGIDFIASPDQPDGFPVYYKPSGTNRSGDPMPFYDTNNNNYKVLYLFETINNGQFFHPIYGVETTDAFSYKNLGEIRPVGNGDTDKDASIGTGCCVIDADGKYHLFYTRHNNTNNDPINSNPKESVMHVTATTLAGLKTATGTVVVTPSMGNYSNYDFRDPDVFKGDDDLWHMVVATKQDSKGLLAEYTSSDLIAWTHKGVFLKCMWDRFYECPNVFKMGDYWYLVYSELHNAIRRVQYFKASSLSALRSVTGNGESASWPDSREGYLCGRGLYAGKTASNGTERILWGWSSYPADNNDKQEWAGALVPHKLQQNADGSLVLVEPTSFSSKFTNANEVKKVESDESHVLFDRLPYQSRYTFSVNLPDAAANFGLSFARGNNHAYYTLRFVYDSNAKNRVIKMYEEGSGSKGYIEGQDSYYFTQPAAATVGDKSVVTYRITMVTDNSVLTLYVSDKDGNHLCTYTCRIPNLSNNGWGLTLYDANNETYISDITIKEGEPDAGSSVWQGSHAIDWSNTLSIAAEKFSDLQMGQKLVFSFSNATGEVVELKSDGNLLPGTRYAHNLHADQSSFEVFATKGMVEQLQKSGLEVCGKGWTLNKVEIADGKDNVTDNTVWTGFFWMDSWSTLEIGKTSFAGINWADYKAIRFYSEANRTDYVINILAKWGDGGKISDQNSMTMTNDYAELNIEDIDMAARLADVDRMMIQCNKEGGNPFNFTAVELIPKDATGIQSISSSSAKAMKTYNLAGQQVSANAKGIVIRNGKKMINL